MDPRDDSEKKAHLERLRQALREGEESGFIENFEMRKVLEMARKLCECRTAIETGYADMAADEEHERKAMEWSDGLIGDANLDAVESKTVDFHQALREGEESGPAVIGTNRMCPECGAAMVFKTKTEILEYKGHQKQIETKGWWCGSCGEGILDGEALKASDAAFRELKAKVGSS